MSDPLYDMLYEAAASQEFRLDEPTAEEKAKNRRDFESMMLGKTDGFGRPKQGKVIDEIEALKRHLAQVQDLAAERCESNESLRSMNTRLLVAARSALAWFDGFLGDEGVPGTQPWDDLREAIAEESRKCDLGGTADAGDDRPSPS